MDDEKLAETVEGFHCLCNVSEKSYKDRAQESAWREVSKVIGELTEECTRKCNSFGTGMSMSQEKLECERLGRKVLLSLHGDYLRCCLSYRTFYSIATPPVVTCSLPNTSTQCLSIVSRPTQQMQVMKHTQCTTLCVL